MNSIINTPSSSNILPLQFDIPRINSSFSSLSLFTMSLNAFISLDEERGVEVLFISPLPPSFSLSPLSSSSSSFSLSSTLSPLITSHTSLFSAMNFCISLVGEERSAAIERDVFRGRYSKDDVS